MYELLFGEYLSESWVEFVLDIFSAQKTLKFSKIWHKPLVEGGLNDKIEVANEKMTISWIHKIK
jgi:hypothetical protein